jgi:hypothetical protein
VDLLVLEELLGDKHHGIFKIWLACKGLSDVVKEGDLTSGHHNITPSNTRMWNSSG